MKKIRLNKYARLAIKLIITIAALVYVFSRIEFTEVIKLYSQLNILWLLLAIFFFILSKILSAFRLNIFFRKIDLNLTAVYNLKLYWLGMYYNLFLPGGIGGDGYKIYLLNREHEVKTRKIIWAILMDRTTGLVSIVYLLVVLSYFISLNITFNYRCFAWFLIPVSLALFYLFVRIFSNYLTTIFARVNIQAFIIQVMQLICAACIFYALGHHEEVPAYLFLFLISSIVAALPVTVGGAGSREITFLIGAGLMGLNVEVSVAMSLMFYLITAFISLFGIIYSLDPSRLGKPNQVMGEKNGAVS